MKKLILILFITTSFSLMSQSNKGTFKVRKTNTSEVFTIVDEMPSFPGGEEVMMQFLSENVIYPDSALKNNISGKIYVNFIIEVDGSISDVKVIRGINKLLDQEAIRVVKLMPNWKPGKQKGKSVAVSYNIPINFVLK